MTNRTLKTSILYLVPLLLLLGGWWLLRDEGEGVVEPPGRPEGRGGDGAGAGDVEGFLSEGEVATGTDRSVAGEAVAATEGEGPGPAAPTAEGTTVGEFVVRPDLRVFDFKDCLRLHSSLEGAAIRVSILSEESGGWSWTSKGPMSGLGLDMEAGVYLLEIAAEKDGVLVRAKRTLLLGDGPVELPVVDLVPMAGVRARVVDAGGIPVPQARILVVRPEELAVGGHRIEPGPEGWIHYADLEPGVDHRLVVEGLMEPVERVVRVPPEPKGTAVEEVRCAAHLVPVKFRFENEAGQLLPPKAVEPGLPRTGHRWPDCTALGDRLLPGTYEFKFGELAGQVTIPPGRPFEARIRLEPAE